MNKRTNELLIVHHCRFLNQFRPLLK